MKLALASGLAAVAVTGGVLFAVTSASAINCPPPTQPGNLYVAGRTVSGCFGPVVQCDPRPCDPTAAAPQE